MNFKHRHLLDITSLSREDIVTILNLAEQLKEISKRPIKKVPTLRGRTVVNLFMEPSTRTRSSFEIAEKRLSADSLNVSASSPGAPLAPPMLKISGYCSKRFFRTSY